MLAVMAVITVLFGLSATVLRPQQDNQEVRSGVGSLKAIFREAGLVARAQNRPVRILLNCDPANKDRYLRYVGIQVMKMSNTGQEEWTNLGRGVLLSDRVRVFDEYLGSSMAADAGDPVSQVSASFPQNQGTASDWLAFDIDSRGFCRQTGRVLVVGPANGAESANNKANRRGLLILRTGVPMELESVPSL